VWEVDPREACGGKPVALAWFSPDCKHHSKAKGGKPRDQKIRGLAWVAVTWAARVRPRVIALENVEEFRDWGPLHRTGPRAGHPIAARRGETFRALVRRLERLGYVVEHRLLRACDYGAPTTRRRLFLIARRDGQPIAWPTPTHGNVAGPRQLELGARAMQPYRTAAEVIDWSITCPSIFDRERPLAGKTMARIARGIRKFVLEHPRPFVLKAKTHGGGGNAPMSVDEPLRTVTASPRGEFAIAVPYLVHRSNGERPGQAPRIYDAERPLGTIVAQGQKHALVAAFLAKHYGDRATGGWSGGAAADRPIDTITARDHHSAVVANLVRYNGDRAGAERVADVADPIGTLDTSRRYGLIASHLIKLRGTSPAHIVSSASGLEEPTPTISAQGTHAALVAAFLARYNGTSTGQEPDAPIGTLDTTDRYALVTVTIGGEPYVIVDIGMRMLTPRELFRAQGFGDDYQIAPNHNGKPLSKTAQIRMCGNSVCPPIAAAIVRAQFQEAA
jgi:DNA (cytosine-5)-methyltransferase 1